MKSYLYLLMELYVLNKVLWMFSSSIPFVDCVHLRADSPCFESLVTCSVHQICELILILFPCKYWRGRDFELTIESNVISLDFLQICNFYWILVRIGAGWFYIHLLLMEYIHSLFWQYSYKLYGIKGLKTRGSHIIIRKKEILYV